MNKSKILLVFLVLLCFTSTNILMVHGSGSLELEIEESEGGYCILAPGTYYYDQQDAEISMFAYAYPNYYFSGWIVNGTYESSANPIVIDLDNDSNVTMSLYPAFSTEQHFYVFVVGSYPVFVTLNNELVQASATGTPGVYQGGSTITVQYIDDPNYDFNSFLLYGTTTITTKTFNFILEENTLINIDVDYDPVYIPPDVPEDPLPISPIISPDYFTLQNLVSIIPPGIIIGALGLVFSEVGQKLDNHNYAGFLIGGCIGLLLCTVQGLTPVWFTVLIFFVGSIFIYFWFRSGE